MKTKGVTTGLLLALLFSQAYSQNATKTESASLNSQVPGHKFALGTAYHTFLNFGEEKTNTHHYEFHFGYQLTPKDKVGIKLATWKMYAPMGMPMKEQLKFDESNNYPGRLRESGIGVTYQRMMWRGLFTAIEILPQLKTYLGENDKKNSIGFKLYTSYHLGYHISLFKDRMFIEPQIQCQYWPIDTNSPQDFKEKDRSWNNYFLFEPNLYIGIRF